MKTNNLSHRLEIRGRVQGVFYRQSMVEQALRLGVTGWVRNRLDGSVEAVIAGDKAAVQALLDWARRGPPGALVTEVSIYPAEADFDSFARLPTA